jgi:cyclopropane-fatty-acyl-phospholipid synthase
MWEFYLAACEMLFRNGPLMVFHLQLAQRRDAVPLTRDYVTAFEHSVVPERSRRQETDVARREAEPAA